MAIGAIWADIWNEAIWDTTIWSQVAVEPEPEPEPAKQGGRSKRIRYVVEVDGQFLEVSNIAEAESVFRNARELAEVSARRDVRPAVRIKPPRVSIRTATGKPVTSQTLRRAVESTQQAVNEIYRKAQVELERTREISRLIHDRLAAEDEDEAVLALLL